MGSGCSLGIGKPHAGAEADTEDAETRPDEPPAPPRPVFAEPPGPGVRAAVPPGMPRDADPGAADAHDLPPPPPVPYQWEWQQGPESWSSFEPEIARKFIVAQRLGMKKLVYCSNGNAYVADLEKHEQTNRVTGYTRKLRLVRDVQGKDGRTAAQRASASAAFDAYGRTGGRGRRDVPVQFQWQLKNGDWVDYEDDECSLISKAWAAGKSAVKYEARGHDYEIDFKDMVQVNLGTSQARSIRAVECKKKKHGDAHQEQFTNFGDPRKPPPAPRERAHSSEHERPRRPPSKSPPPAAEPKRRPSPSPAAARERPAERFHAFGRRPPHEDPGPRRRRSPSPPPAAAAPPFRRGAPPKKSYEDPGPRPAPDPFGVGGTRRAEGARRGSCPPSSHISLPSGVEMPQNEKARREAETLFRELEAVSRAPMDERKKAFKNACVRWHPDKNPDDEDVATEMFQFVQSLKPWLFA
eukprot:TRINITY_DN1986_c1_g1_i2.p1 TRINITY_DN1986_c1_g1~~TRINITY_DN1986_c1_g1_i2.p1  ORF type:complete len:467 (+),score=62.12 TRINITY_DN1986_c1_g1_i2:86-1486(+)